MQNAAHPAGRKFSASLFAAHPNACEMKHILRSAGKPPAVAQMSWGSISSV